MSEIEERLKDQLGDIGGESSSESSSESPLGKIKKPNNKEMTESESKALDDFINRTNSKMSFISHEEDESAISVPKTIDINKGWVPVDRTEMGIRSMFYPESYSFRVKQATTDDIKNWSSIDEKNIIQVNDALNDIMHQCVAIYDNGVKKTWEHINSWDRFWFLLKVREVTFANGNYSVEFSESCPECDKDIIYKLTSSALFYELPDDEIIEEYYDSARCLWTIDPSEYGVDEQPITLYVPTLGKDAAIVRWASKKYQETGKKPNEVFLKYLPWLLSKAPKDEKILDKFIKQCKQQYDSWSVDMFGFMDSVIPKITVNPSSKLKTCCPYCGEEATSNVDFPDGLKRLFFVQGRYTKFGEKRNNNK